MTKTPVHFSVAAIMTVVLVGAAQIPAVALEPIVVNDGFDQRTDGAFVGWEREINHGCEKVHAGVDRVDYHRESECLKWSFRPTIAVAVLPRPGHSRYRAGMLQAAM